jgi:hypothetical protein
LRISKTEARNDPSVVGKAEIRGQFLIAQLPSHDVQNRLNSGILKHNLDFFRPQIRQTLFSKSLFEGIFNRVDLKTCFQNPGTENSMHRVVYCAARPICSTISHKPRCFVALNSQSWVEVGFSDLQAEE